MRVLVVGGGGREHALCWRLSRDASVGALFAAPGNAGIASEAECVPVASDDLDGLVALVERERIDLTVVGPEIPLVAGLADRLVARGHAVFGPSMAAARIEGSKAWAKSLMQRAGVPTARSATFSRAEWERDRHDALAFLHGELGGGPAVVKADGLAAGKGVVVADSAAEAAQAVEACLGGGFGEAGSTVVIEERLSGPEVSAFALSDGREVVPLAMAQDFKRIGDGDAGPNTGGMGAYSPVPFVDDRAAERIRTRILEPTVRAMAEEGSPYRGVLYAGLMLTADGPKALEFNCRFGDPETQVLMPRLASAPAELLLACARGDLAGSKVMLHPDACVTVVLASGGYPGPFDTGFAIDGLDEAGEVDGAIVFHSGTEQTRGRVVTAGGRVLSVSAVGDSLREARDRAYRACARIAFEGKQHRTDVAAMAAGEDGS